MKIKQINESIISVSEINNINRIWNQLVSSVQNDIEINNINYYGFRTFCCGEFVVNDDNIGNITIKYTIYLLDDEKALKYFYNGTTELSCSADFETKVIEIRGMFINETPYQGLYSELSHEYHHLYQYSKGFSKTEFTDNLYEKVRMGYQSDNDVVSITSMVLYYTFKHEISAFSTELYQYLVSNYKKYRSEDLKLDDLFNLSPNYCNFEDKMDEYDGLIKDKSNCEAIEEYFGISIKQINQRIDNAINLWKVYFNKVLSKYCQLRALSGHHTVTQYGKFVTECKKLGYECKYDIIL